MNFGTFYSKNNYKIMLNKINSLFFFAKKNFAKKRKKNFFLTPFFILLSQKKMNKLLLLVGLVAVFGAGKNDNNGNNGKAVGNPFNGNNGVNGNGKGNAGGSNNDNGGGKGPSNSGGGDNNGKGKGNNGGSPPIVPPVVPVVSTPSTTSVNPWLQALGVAMLFHQDDDNLKRFPWCDVGKPLKNELGHYLFCNPNAGNCPLGSECTWSHYLQIGKCCPNMEQQVVLLPQTVLLPPVLIAKCSVGSPWKDLNGFDLYCGPPAFGSMQVNCPLGSECVSPENNAYFACCSV